MKQSDFVVLLHGLCGSRLDMWPLAMRLARRGYETRNWGYRSFGARIENVADHVVRRLNALESELGEDQAIHVVTHSMGGVILRAALQEQSFPAVRRIVMLAPPHQGSHVARKLAPFLGWLAPSLEQLSDAPGSYVNGLGNSFAERGIEFGIIEAERDRVISRGAVQLAGNRDFATVDGHHGILTWYPSTLQLVESFLHSGSFACARRNAWERNGEVRDASTAGTTP